MKMKILAILSLLILTDYAQCKNTTTVNSCDDVLLPEVQFSTNNIVCEQGPCIVRPGSDLVLKVYFKSPKYLEHIKMTVIASALGVELEYPLNEDDACVGIVNTYCPLVTDELIEYTHTMHLLDIFPEAAVGLTFSLIDKDNNNTDVICFAIDIQLKKT